MKSNTLPAICLLNLLSLALPSTAWSQSIADSTVYISTAIEYSDGRRDKAAEGSGFIVDSGGYVVTARHLIPKEIPAGAKLIIQGTVKSRYSQQFPLTSADFIPLGVDITLLRFPQAIRSDWPALKLGESKDFKLGDTMIAWGFPLGQDLTRAQTQIQSLSGPDNTVQVGAGLFPGMSGGPVVNKDGNAVGVVTGGAPGFPTMTFFTPLHYGTPLLSITKAQWVREGGISTDAPATVKVYDVKQVHTIPRGQSQVFSISELADEGKQITSAKFIPGPAQGASDFEVEIAADRKKVDLRFRLSGGDISELSWLYGRMITEQQ